MTVIFPKPPIIIAINLNTTENRRISLESVVKLIVELFAIVNIVEFISFM
jgi:hypothetical protein